MQAGELRDRRAAEPSAALSITGLVKRYGRTTVLDEVDFDLKFGEIHALLGENGAGKSTLIKVLAGAVGRDAGEIRVRGRDLPEAHRPEDVSKLGVAFVHQHLGLFDDLSVAENVALVAGYEGSGPFISHRETEAVARTWLTSIGAAIEPDAFVGDMPQDEKVLCAIARAVATNAQIIVLDEVSASLPAPEMDRLAQMLIAAKRDGLAYVYVTHRLPEVFQLADRVTVLRDGKVSITTEVAKTDHDEIVRHILGRDHISTGRSETEVADRPTKLKVVDLIGPGLSAPLSFEVGSGEVLGICGLVGSGARSVARLLGGADHPTGGAALLDDALLPLGDPKALANIGCAYIPGDRNSEGALSDLSIRENLFPDIRPDAGESEAVVRWPSAERRHAGRLMQLYAVRPNDDPDRPLSDLSGGNRQKVIFARALRTHRDLLILEDPTAGVDIGSRSALYDLMRGAAADGTAVLMVSTDFEEVAAQADRVIIMREGRAVQEISLIGKDPEAAEAELAHASYGSVGQRQAAAYDVAGRG